MYWISTPLFTKIETVRIKVWCFKRGPTDIMKSQNDA